MEEGTQGTDSFEEFIDIITNGDGEQIKKDLIRIYQEEELRKHKRTARSEKRKRLSP